MFCVTCFTDPLKTVSVIIERDVLPNHDLLDPLVFLLLRSVERLVSVALGLQPDKLRDHVVRLLVFEFTNDARVDASRQALQVSRF